MSSSARILTGLLLGLATGLVASTTQSAVLSKVLSVVEPIGTAWVNGLQMTAIPLVVSLIVVGAIAAGERGIIGRAAGRAALLFVVLYVFAAGTTALVVSPVLSDMNVVPGSERIFPRSVTRDSTLQRPTVSVTEQLTGLIPANALKAAADGAMLPLFVFFALFALALTRVAAGPREQVAQVFRGTADAMLVLVGWLIVVAPIGVFAVIAPLTARVGATVIGALAYYVVLLVALCVLATIALYPLAARFGRVSLRTFTRAAAPSQAVAFSTQSSLASLPAMVEGAQERLGAPRPVVGVVLPLAVAVFRYTTPIWLVVAALFVAKLSGSDLTLSQRLTLVVLSVIVSFAGVGLPGAASYFIPITPVFLAMGLPVEAIAVLFAVDTIPDMIETVGNVTADMAVVAIVATADSDLRAFSGIPPDPISAAPRARG